MGLGCGAFRRCWGRSLPRRLQRPRAQGRVDPVIPEESALDRRWEVETFATLANHEDQQFPDVLSSQYQSIGGVRRGKSKTYLSIVASRNQNVGHSGISSQRGL